MCNDVPDGQVVVLPKAVCTLNADNRTATWVLATSGNCVDVSVTD